MPHAHLTRLWPTCLAWSLQTADQQGTAVESLISNFVFFLFCLVYFSVFAVVTVAALTLVFGAFALPPVAAVQWLYRRTVQRWMSRRAGAAGAPEATPPPAQPTPAHAARPAALRFQVHEADAADAGDVSPLRRTAEEASRAVTRVYVAAGVAYAAAMTPLAANIYFLYLNAEAARLASVPASFYLVTFLSLLWLPVLVFLVACVGRRGWKLTVTAAYVLLITTAAFALPDEAVVILWVTLMSAPTSTMLVLRFSGVAGLALGTILSLVAAAFPLLAGLLGFSKFGPAEQMPEWYGLVVLGSIPASALLAVGLLWWLSRRYARKRTSEQILLLDGFWLSATFIISFLCAITTGMYAVLGVLPFVLYKLVVWAGLRRLAREQRGGSELQLLLLRVFGAKRRSEWLLKRLGHYWRYAGSIQLIAAPDLAAANLEIDELLAFVTGRLKRRYVKDSEDCARRVESLDARPDPDGRYRVNEFFCHEDVWQPTVAALTRRSDAVLMDLRGFTALNRGCIKELFHLVDAVPVNRLVLLINEETDDAFLRQTFVRAWAAMGAASPNRRLPVPVLRLLRIRRQNARAVRRLLSLLGEAARAAPAPAPPAPAPAARPQPVVAWASLKQYQRGGARRAGGAQRR